MRQFRLYALKLQDFAGGQGHCIRERTNSNPFVRRDHACGTPHRLRTSGWSYQVICTKVTVSQGEFTESRNTHPQRARRLRNRIRKCGHIMHAAIGNPCGKPPHVGRIQPLLTRPTVYRHLWRGEGVPAVFK